MKGIKPLLYMKVLGENGTNVLVDEIKRIRQSVETNSEKLELISPNYIEGTYAEIKALMESGQLYPGAKYLIKDHKLHYNAANIEILTDYTYEVLLTANTVDSFSMQVQWRIVGEKNWQNASYSLEAKIYGADVEYVDKEHTGVMWDISYNGKQYPFMPDAFAINIPRNVSTVRFDNHKTVTSLGISQYENAVHQLKDGKYLHIYQAAPHNHGQYLFASINDDPSKAYCSFANKDKKFSGYDKCCWLLPDGETYGYFDCEAIGTQIIRERIILISKDLQTIDERWGSDTIADSPNYRLLVGDTYKINGVTYEHAGYYQDYYDQYKVVISADDANFIVSGSNNIEYALVHNGIFAQVLGDDFYTDGAPKNIFNLKSQKDTFARISTGFFDTEANKHIICTVNSHWDFTGNREVPYFIFNDKNIYNGDIKYVDGKLYDWGSREDITELIAEKLQRPNIIQLGKDAECGISSLRIYDSLAAISSPLILPTDVIWCSEMPTVDQIIPTIFEGHGLPPKRIRRATSDKPNYIIPNITHDSASEVGAQLCMGVYGDELWLSQAKFRSKNKKYLSAEFNAKILSSMFEQVQTDDDSIILDPNDLTDAAILADGAIHITQQNGLINVKYEVNGEPK